MSELLKKVLIDKSARQAEVLSNKAAKAAAERSYPWA
jgi:hypothetical protein